MSSIQPGQNLRSPAPLRPLRPITRADLGWLSLLLVAAFGIAIYGMGRTGLTWDEPDYFSSGAAYFKWLLSPSWADLRSAWALNKEHPPIHKLLAGFTHWLFTEKLSLARPVVGYRLGSLPFLGLALSCTYWIGYQLQGRRLAVLGAIFLFLTPRVFFHAQLVSLDLSSMALWALLAALILRHRLTAGSLYPIALAAALAFLAKINAIFAFVSVPALFSFRQYLRPRITVLGPALLFFAVIFVLWPWLWLDPISNLRHFISFHLKHFPLRTLYFGEAMETPSWHYPYVLYLITTPALLAAGTLLSLGAALRELRRSRKLETADLFLLANAFFPLLLVQLSPVKYDGIRLFLPAFPFLSLLAARGLLGALEKIRPRLKLSETTAFIGLLVVTLSPLSWGLTKTFPYPDSYFSEAIGGTAGAQKLGFEIESWCEGYLEILAHMESRPRQNVWFAACGNLPPLYPELFGVKLNFTQVHHPDDADLLVVINRMGRFEELFKDQLSRQPKIDAVKLNGVDLVGVYDARRKSPWLGVPPRAKPL
jgi:4-amino-4-deoxy-L-arabinose transferase-like glycosyltransferase